MKCVFALTALAAGAAMLGAKDHVRLNLTASMPVGLWWMTGTVEPRRGDAVMVCLPVDVAITAFLRGYIGAGDCAGDRESLLKPVAALFPDVVTVTAEGITVNQTPIPNSVAWPLDHEYRPLDAIPPGQYPVAPGTAWIVGSHDARSFDSRYFGAVPLSAMTATAHPILTW